MTRRHFGFLVEVLEALLLTIVVFFVIQTFIAQPFRVEQGSMETTLHEGQYILIDKVTPLFDGYSRGDIIVFRPPASANEPDDTPFIKRVIGEPGDQIAIHDGKVWVNGVALDESSYVYDGEPTYPTDPALSSWTVPAGSLFVLGDHRDDSTDSRTARLGLIPIDHVIGRAVLRYWPLSSVALIQPPTYTPIPVAAAGIPDAASAPFAGTP